MRGNINCCLLQSFCVAISVDQCSHPRVKHILCANINCCLLQPFCIAISVDQCSQFPPPRKILMTNVPTQKTNSIVLYAEKQRQLDQHIQPELYAIFDFRKAKQKSSPLSNSSSTLRSRTSAATAEV